MSVPPPQWTYNQLSWAASQITVMHDRNDNGELDANFVGMPTEPWAFSNNATGSFGPPGWEQVKFAHQGDTVQRIRLNN